MTLPHRRGYLAMSIPTGGEGSYWHLRGCRSGMLLNIVQCTGQPHDKESCGPGHQLYYRLKTLTSRKNSRKIMLLVEVNKSKVMEVAGV